MSWKWTRVYVIYNKCDSNDDGSDDPCLNSSRLCNWNAIAELRTNKAVGRAVHSWGAATQCLAEQIHKNWNSVKYKITTLWYTFLKSIIMENCIKSTKAIIIKYTQSRIACVLN